MGDDQFYISIQGQQSGPFVRDEVERKIASGEVSLNDMAWQVGLPDWVALQRLLPPTLPASIRPVGPPPLPQVLPITPTVAAHSVPVVPKRKSLTWLWVTLGVGLVLLFVGLAVGAVFLIRTVTEHGTDEVALRPLLEERSKHQPQWRKSDYTPAGPADVPDGKVFELIRYRSEGRDLAAYLTPDPKDGKKHPAIVWAHGGFGGIGSYFWESASKRDDQSARAFREKGIVMMCPSWRGENDNPGRFELFYGEVEDFLWAIQHVKKLPYVDPERVYIGGHSTGGTMTLLAAVSSDQFRAAFSFGGMIDGVATLGDGEGYGNTPYDPASNIDHRLRSPTRYAKFMRRPTFYFEGGEYYDGISAWAMKLNARGRLQTFQLPGDHFDILHPITPLIAEKILQDTGPKCNIRFTELELKQRYEVAFSRTLATELEAWSRTGGSLSERFEKADPDNVQPHTEADVKALVQAVKQLKAHTPETAANLATLAELRNDIQDDELLETFDQQAVPALIMWANGRLNNASAFEKQEAEHFFSLLEAVAGTTGPAAADLVVAAVNSGILPDSHGWSSVFDTYDEEHPNTAKVMSAFAADPPSNLTGMLLLDAANQNFLNGWHGPHPYDSEKGLALLKGWLMDADPEKSGHAHSAALGAAFVNEKRRAELITLALNHADKAVQMEGAWSDVKAGNGAQGLAFLKAACLKLHQSARAQDYLKELERDKDIPVLEPAFDAQATLSQWLQHPTELGGEPLTMEVYDHKKLFWPPSEDDREIWLIKFTHKDEAEIKTSYGCVGSMTWSSFDEFTTPPTPAELYLHHCTLEMERDQHRTEGAAKKDEARSRALEALKKGNPGVFDSVSAAPLGK